MDYTQIIATAAGVVVLTLMHLVGAYVILFIHKHIKSNALDMGLRIAQTAVAATEQMGKVYGINGPQKAAFALSQARTLASNLGVSFTDQQWQSLIEQAVAEINHLAVSLVEGTSVTLPPLAAPIFSRATPATQTVTVGTLPNPPISVTIPPINPALLSTLPSLDHALPPPPGIAAAPAAGA